MRPCWVAPGWVPITRRTKPWLGAWNFQPHSHFPERGEELEMELIDQAYVRKPPKIPKVLGSERFKVSGTSTQGGWGTPTQRRQKFLYSGPSQTSSSSSGCSSVSFVIFFNKLVNVHQFSTVFCEPLQQINQIQGRDCGNPQFVAKSDRSCGNLGTYYLQLAPEVGSVLWEWALNLQGLTLSSR